MEDHTTAQSLLSQLITAPDEAQAKVMYQYVSEMNSGTFDKLLDYRRNRPDYKRMDDYLASPACPFKTFDCSKIKVVPISNMRPVQTIIPHPECHWPPMEAFTRNMPLLQSCTRLSFTNQGLLSRSEYLPMGRTCGI